MNYKPSGAGATVGNMILPKIVLGASEALYYPAGPASQSGAVGGIMRISLTSARVTGVHVNGVDKTSTCPFYVYAR